MAVVSSTHASLPSLPQSPLLPRLSPRSPRPEVESMFTHEGSGQSPSNAHRGTSIREIEEEDGSGSGSGSGGKLYVAVGKDLKDSRSNIRWAARNLLDGDLKLVLLHVHHPAERIMTDLVIIKRAVCILGCRGRGLTPFRKKNLFFLFNPMLAKRLLSGITVSAELCKVPASQLEEKKLKAYRTNEKEEMNTLLNQYLDFKKIQVQAETLVIEKNSPATGIIELIDQNHITKLVMGTSSISAYDQMQYFSFIKRKRTVPKSKVAAIVHLQAKPYCQIFYICKEALACSREANRLSAQVESPRSSCASSVSDQSEFTPRSLSLPPGHPGSLGSKDEQALQRRSNSVSYTLSGLIEDSVSGLIPDSVENMSAATQQSIHMTPTGLSLNSSQRSTGGSSQSLKDLDSIDGSPAPVSIASSEEHRHSMVESIESEVFEQLQRVHNQLERSRKEASKGRQKAERDLFEASIMFKARENSLRKGKKEVEERLTREKTGLEKEHIHICNELQKANERREELENNFLQANSLMEELVNLIGVCREAKALVFEFLSNGSLEDRLQCKNQTKPLPWRMRIRIAADICTGLIFLHSNKPQGIAHGDLKPDNVLLDTSLVCKLADFGISRRLNLTNTTVTPYHQTDQIKGTMGYMDPVYTASGELTSQSDVYSFGVVLLRLLTGKIPLGLPNEVEAALSNEMLQDIIDTSAGEWPPEYTEELARLALRCCRLDRKERPDLAKEVWGVLQAMTNCPYKKCQPPPFFICPITQEIMRDPHIASDGFTYEGEAIKDWLQRGHKVSPTTYLSFTHHELIPNSALRFAIQEWQMQQEP